MRKTAATFEAVRALGREFPDLQESTMYGSPALGCRVAEHGWQKVGYLDLTILQIFWDGSIQGERIQLA